jgi:DNA polymerase
VTLARSERLKALGLWPVWRMRASEQAEPVVESSLSPEGRSAGLENLPDDAWTRLREEVVRCTRCGLHASRTQGVPGVGDTQADWLIIGEAPGADEDRLGEPFVGQAGKLLDAMLAAIGLKRGEDVYIANVLKSRPPGNRDPKPEEVAACLPYLERQIELIQPKLILALGRFAAQSLLASTESISRMRGRMHSYRGVPLIVTYHPAYLLRNLPDKAKAWDDLCMAKEAMARLKHSDNS